MLILKFIKSEASLFSSISNNYYFQYYSYISIIFLYLNNYYDDTINIYNVLHFFEKALFLNFS